jgi:RimJ/RimL family protein N-acetyltransferase
MSDILTSPIETERLRIRRFDYADWEALSTYTTDPLIMKYMEEGPHTVEQAQDFVRKSIEEEVYALPVILKSEERLIGHMVFHPWFAPRTYEIGWAFHPAYHRQGFAPEAALALLRYGFETLRLHRIIATCQPENKPSYRVMEKIGMRREGHFQKCIYRDETTWWDEYFYAILEEAWFKEPA